MKHKPLSLDELKKQRKAVINTALEHKQQLNRLEKLAIFITKYVGSMGFFILLFTWTILWFIWNALAPADLRFDPYPAFVLWLFISNMIQLVLLPLLMVGQNIEGRHSEIRAKNDYEINLKSEKEIETILQHLENQTDAILEIIETLKNKKRKK
ncbi:MAG: DUF1003 domain-containing protein [Patescibacteria group bacterium]